MISLRRTTLVFLVLVASAFGVGLGSWGAGAVDSAKSQRQRSTALQAPIIPAALPIPSGSFAQIAETVGPAVVNINTVTRGGAGGRTPIEEFFGDEFFRRFFGDEPERERQQQRSLGSGVIVDTSGIALTNAHVVERATEIEVVTSDGKKHKAKLVGVDRRTDLAVLRLQGGGPFPAAALGDSERVKVGDWVLAIGSPFGLTQTVTAGIISAKGRSLQGPFDDFLQTDAAINPGNSGGPLVNMAGEVIGINSAILSRSGGNVGIGFAIPVSMAKRIYTELVAKGKITRGWLGVTIQPLTPELAKSFGLKEPKGVLVSDILQDSPAEKAGMAAGDIITEFGGKKVDSPQELQKVVAATGPGKSVPIAVWRDKAQKTMQIQIGETPDDNAALKSNNRGKSLLGLDVRPITPELARQLNLRGTEGVVVFRVEEESAAAEAGLQRGDVIRELNRQRVRNVQEFERVARDLKDGDRVTVLLQRGPQALYVAFTVARG